MDAIIEIGQPAPDFELPDLNGAPHRLSDFRDAILILNFWSAECPWSERADQELLQLLAHEPERVHLWTIASNLNETAAQIRSVATSRGLPVVLLDQGHKVADRYGAVTTPHLYIIDPGGILRYQGALDDITFRKRTASRHYLQAAVTALLSGHDPEVPKTQPYGCTIVRHRPD